MNVSWRNTTTAWGSVAIALHWLVAALIIGQFVLGDIAADAPVSPAKLDLFVWHKSLGATILLLVFLRLAWRLSNPVPALPQSLSRRERQLARLGHGLLYGLMVAVPISGWVVSDASRIPFRIFWSLPTPDLLASNRELSESAAEVHEALVALLALTVLGHILAALHHHFMKHNDVLLKMLPWRRPQ